MESRKRSRREPAPSRVELPGVAGDSAALPYIAMLIDDGGQITIGAMHPLACVAIANDHHGSLAMLRRRFGESITELLRR